MKKLIFTLASLIFSLVAISQNWSLSGNSGTNPAINFLGTGDNKPLMFRVNNVYSGEIDSVTATTFFGYGAGKDVTGGFYNVAIGFKALMVNTTGNSNTAVGTYSLAANTTGFYNSANGGLTLYANTTGSYNTANGFYSLRYNTTGSYHTATGYSALFNNTTGYGNTAHGIWTLYSNTTGSRNVAGGYQALFYNTTGSYNTAIGNDALMYTSASNYNTALGYNAANSYNLGSNNTFLGANTDGSATGQYNMIAIGYGTVCPSSNSARIGTVSTYSIGGWVNWSNYSDRRFKKNITENVKGLDFIMRLRPVTYNLDVSGASKKIKENAGQEWDENMKKAMAEKENELFSGFIAQEVEQAAKETRYNFSGIDKPRNENSFYGLRYAEFVVPLVKAVQEQQQMINELQKRIIELERKQGISFSPGNSTNALNVWPNPSNDKLFITIDADNKSQALIKIFDSKGSLLKQQQSTLIQGSNQLSIDVKELANGTYHVSAEWNEGKMKKTAQVIKQ